MTEGLPNLLEGKKEGRKEKYLKPTKLKELRPVVGWSMDIGAYKRKGGYFGGNSIERNLG